MRIVVVEDQAMLCEALRRVCVLGCGYDVVGMAGTGAEAIALIEEFRPDLVVLDIGLPDMDGFAVAEFVRETVPSARILVLTGHLDEWTVFRAEKLRVHGFLDKTSNTTALFCEALAALAAGRTFYSPSYLSARLARSANTASFEKVLSDAEQIVLALVGEGLSDEEIGGRLGIAPTTAQTHRSKILQKLHIKGSAKLVAYAIINGFTRIPSRSTFLQGG